MNAKMFFDLLPRRLEKGRLPQALLVVTLVDPNKILTVDKRVGFCSSGVMGYFKGKPQKEEAEQE